MTAQVVEAPSVSGWWVMTCLTCSDTPWCSSMTSDRHFLFAQDMTPFHADLEVMGAFSKGRGPKADLGGLA